MNETNTGCMACDRRIVGESDLDYKERLEYNIRVPYDSYIEGRASFLCEEGKIFDGDDFEDIVEYLRDECSEEVYDSVAIVDKQIDDHDKFAIPFMYQAETNYTDQ